MSNTMFLLIDSLVFKISNRCHQFFYVPQDGSHVLWVACGLCVRHGCPVISRVQILYTFNGYAFNSTAPYTTEFRCDSILRLLVHMCSCAAALDARGQVDITVSSQVGVIEFTRASHDQLNHAMSWFPLFPRDRHVSRMPLPERNGSSNIVCSIRCCRVSTQTQPSMPRAAATLPPQCAYDSKPEGS